MNVDEMPTPQLIRLVQTWPTVREVAVEYALPEWWIRTQVERSRVRAMKLTTLRIDPDDWRRFLRDSMTTPAAASPTGPARPAEATTQKGKRTRRRVAALRASAPDLPISPERTSPR